MRMTARTENRLVGAVAWAMLLGWMLACSSGNEGPALPDLEAGVKASALELELTNKDDRDWVNIDVHVNTSSRGTGGYHAHVDALDKGRAVTLTLAAFVDDDGNRYQPLAKAVMNARVDAATNRVPGKRQTYFGTFAR